LDDQSELAQYLDLILEYPEFNIDNSLGIIWDGSSVAF
jgi:hypothetical protein